MEGLGILAIHVGYSSDPCMEASLAKALACELGPINWYQSSDPRRSCCDSTVAHLIIVVTVAIVVIVIVAIPSPISSFAGSIAIAASPRPCHPCHCYLPPVVVAAVLNPLQRPSAARCS
ncbi:hypothetical protein BHM03_00060941 [Ensete ventricosum]|nr:hypothetical protein BHM03_00060941 [Ensete ventricosum]